MNEHGPEDFSEASALIRRSHAWAMVEGFARIVELSANHSAAMAIASRLRRAIEAMPRAERRRAFALTAAVAFAVHALLLGLVPQPLRPAMPRAFWLMLSAAAAVAAVRRSGKDQKSDA
jgi:hypothetical protein